MSWYDDHKTIALLVQANDSAATAAAVADFAQLKASYEDAGVEFFMINPMGKRNRTAVQAKLAEYGVDIPVLMDDARVISEELGIERTGEVVLFSPSSFEVEYRGSLEGAQAAIDEILAGEAVSVAMTETTGAMVSYEQMASVPSYSQDIAPILAENCASCHREGGIAPFAMDSHTMVKGWSPMIREVLMTKRMPPGQIDGHIGEFINDMLIEDQEVRNIIAWVEAGAPKDDANDPLAELTWPETKWAFGEPDYIIKVPPQSVPATGVVDYRDVAVLIDIPEDRWLRVLIDHDRRCLFESWVVSGDSCPRVGENTRALARHTLFRNLAFRVEPEADFAFVNGLTTCCRVVKVQIEHRTCFEQASGVRRDSAAALPPEYTQ